MCCAFGCSIKENRPLKVTREVTYLRDHEIQFFDPATQEWVTTTVTDTLTFSPAPNGTLHFSVSLLDSNAHTCDLSGIAQPIDGAFEYREALDHFEEPVERI